MRTWNMSESDRAQTKNNNNNNLSTEKKMGGRRRREKTTANITDFSRTFKATIVDKYKQNLFP